VCAAQSALSLSDLCFLLRNKMMSVPYVIHDYQTNLRHMGHSMSSEPNVQHSDPRMKLSICETKTINSFGDFSKR
jgi:hypothetical protein